MRLSDFDFDLPDELIAEHPPGQRGESRLLELDPKGNAVRHRRFPEFVDLLRPEDLLVLNDTRVIPARLRGRKATGGRVELLVERTVEPGRVLAQIRSSKTPAPGSVLRLDGGGEVEVIGREGEFFDCRLLGGDTVDDLLAREGEVPLPPYIRRAPEPADLDRYQTVYARVPGAVAAPTAGLHFDEVMLRSIRARGVDIGSVTLHVGAGTFQPVRTDAIAEHRMHAERVTVPRSTCDQVNRARAAGGRVVAVGTTTVRALETAAMGGDIEPTDADTSLFIYPGFRFRCVDALLTNFHLPRSSLLMMVSAFAGRDLVLGAYREAIRERYRFFSYGDAMFIGGRTPG